MVDTNAKGNRFARDVDPYVQAIWPRARRTGRGFIGSDYSDTGDFAVELKNHAKMELGTWMTQVETDAVREGRKYPLLIHKRRRYSTSRAYVTMPLEDFFQMLADLKGVELPPDLVPVSDESEIPDWPDEGAMNMEEDDV